VPKVKGTVVKPPNALRRFQYTLVSGVSKGFMVKKRRVADTAYRAVEEEEEETVVPAVVKASASTLLSTVVVARLLMGVFQMFSLVAHAPLRYMPRRTAAVDPKSDQKTALPFTPE